MADWSGTDFGAIDDVMFDADEPLDTHAEFKLARNQRYLRQNRGTVVTYSAWAARRMAVPAASKSAYDQGEGFRSTMIIPWIVQPGLERVQMHVVYDLLTPKNADNADPVKVRGRLQRLDESDVTEIKTTASQDVAEIDIQLEEVPTGKPGRDALHLEILSTEPSRVVVDADQKHAIAPDSQVFWGDGTGTTQFEREAAAYLVEPLDDYKAALTLSDDGATTNVQYGTVIVDQTADREVGDPPDATIDQHDVTDEVGESSAIGLRGLSVRTEYRDITPHTDSELAAAQPYDSARSAQLHQQETSALVARRRCVALGAQGADRNTTADDEWPEDHPEYWGYAATETSGYQTIGEATAHLDRDAPDIELQLFIIGTYDDDARRDSVSEIEDASQETDWSIRLTVEQLVDGADWSTAPQRGQASQTFAVDHYPTDTGPVSPHMLQEYWLENSLGASDDRSTTGWLYHEGRMWPRDLRFIQPVSFTISTSSVDPALPVRLTVDAEHTGSLGSAALTRIGLSAWEVPV